jgi:transcriptional regulator with XRE-family HTH domain
VALEISVDWPAIGTRLREVRGDVSQVEFGRLLGVPQNFVSRYERARARPSAEYLAAVARLKNVSLDWLILGREPRRDVRGAPAGSGGDG